MANIGKNGRLAIFGSGGMGRELYDVAVRAMPGREIVFVTDHPNGPILGSSAIGPDELLREDELIIAVGDSHHRKTVADRFVGRSFANLHSCNSLVSPSAQIGEGSVVCDFSVVNSSTVIGRHFQGNVFSQVSHDCRIGDFVTLSPRASVNGWVEIGDGTLIGAGAIIRNGTPTKRLVIGERATVAMGAVVVGDVAAGTTVMGVPARERS
ncbi:MAG TPA: NeuD/PglB/VioB family sugar acetyltransferase [Allosphingosinicella sp.]